MEPGEQLSNYPLAVVTFLWGGNREYFPRHVNALARMVRDKLPVPHSFVCVHSNIPGAMVAEFDLNFVMPFQLPLPVEHALGGLQTPEGDRFPTSYRRLWILSRAASALAQRILLLDIDCVPVNDLTPYVEGDHHFIGWRPASKWGRLGRIAGGQYLVRPGTHHSIYKEFLDDPHKMIRDAAAAGFRGSDQAILSWRLTGAPNWPHPHGIYQSQDMRPQKIRKHPGQPASMANPLILEEWPLPVDARMVHFNGTRKPWTVMHWPWVERHFVPFYDR